MGLCGFGAVRYPGEIASHAVWLYFHFCFNHRDVEELLS
jgi:transposase-like protein